MNICLNVGKVSNLAINHNHFLSWVSREMNPVIFFNNPFQVGETFNFELMNFGLGVKKEMTECFIEYRPYFDDILSSKFAYVDLFIFGKANITITKVKGFYMQLGGPDQYIPEDYLKKNVHPKVIEGERLYYENPCKVKKGDYLFECGGKSSFSNHYILISLITSDNAKATISFSANEYAPVESDIGNYSLDAESEKLLSKKQTPYDFKNNLPRQDIINKCSAKIPKRFNIDYLNEYFGYNRYRDGPDYPGWGFARCDEV